MVTEQEIKKRVFTVDFQSPEHSFLVTDVLHCRLLMDEPESVKLSKQQSGAPAPKRYSPRHCFC